MSTRLVIFGATGNLTIKKLIPALAALVKQHALGPHPRIYFVARTPHTKESYVDWVKPQLTHPQEIDTIASFMTYLPFNFNALESYRQLKQSIGDEPGDVVFYLALGPDLFPHIAQQLSLSGLVRKGDLSRRIAFEKPFGDSLASAQSINALLWDYFDENQLYRVDHYLGKEMIQNILMIRFANMMFEANWNADTIEHVTIVAKETEGIMNRGSYYDQAGASIDMVQSHLMQMAALTAMEVPKSFSEHDIRAAKVTVLQQLTIDPSSIVTGQYEGYRQEKAVNPMSLTETFVAFRATINTPRWRDVPFYFVTGKKLDAKQSEIRIRYRDNPQLRQLWGSQTIVANELVIRVAPEEGVTFALNVKAPGLSNLVQPMAMDYCHDCQYVGNHPEAYQRILSDLVHGDSTLFTRWDEIETEWQLVDAMKLHAPDPITYRSIDDLRPLVEHTMHVTI